MGRARDSHLRVSECMGLGPCGMSGVLPLTPAPPAVPWHPAVKGRLLSSTGEFFLSVFSEVAHPYPLWGSHQEHVTTSNETAGPQRQRDYGPHFVDGEGGHREVVCLAQAHTAGRDSGAGNLFPFLTSALPLLRKECQEASQHPRPPRRAEGSLR